MTYSYYMFNKPAGFLTARTDDKKPTVMEFFPPELRDRIHPVGRLDYDTHGLLLFTDDGRADPALLLPEHHAYKTYEFYGIGQITDEKIRRIENGVFIGESDVVSRPAEFKLLKTYKVREIEDYLPEFRRQRYLKNPEGPAFFASLRICEGKKHQVKLMLRAIDCKIVRLYRTSFAGLTLDPSLKEGEYRPLTEEEQAIITEQIEKNKPDA